MMSQFREMLLEASMFRIFVVYKVGRKKKKRLRCWREPATANISENL